MTKKKELGKGIRALISGIESNEVDEKDKKKSSISNSIYIPLRFIEKNPFQPRFEFEKDQLEQLANSIKLYGIIQPLTLRKLTDNSFQLISGERRYRAAKIAGLKKVPAYIREANDQEMVEMALIENIHRTDLNAIEIAISYQRLIEEFNLTQDKLSDRIGKDRSTISNYIRLLKLPPVIQASIKSSEISMGHARVLAGVSDPVFQMDMFKKIINLSLSVRAAEKLLKSGESKKIQQILKIDEKNAYVQNVEDHIASYLGTKVKVKRNNTGKGEIMIRFQNDFELNRILDLLKD